MAWHEKILRVDLTKGTCQAEPLNMEWAAQYIGSRGLASKYLAAEMDPKADPLSPGNVLIFATGPLTGRLAGPSARAPASPPAIRRVCFAHWPPARCDQSKHKQKQPPARPSCPPAGPAPGRSARKQ